VIGTTGLKRLLQVTNAFLGVGILVFSVRVLPRGSGTKLELRADEDLPRALARPRDDGDGALKTIHNPLENRPLPSAPADPPMRAALRGTLSGTVAFLRSLARNVDLVAFVGGEILQDGRPCDELRGWTLAAVGRDTALFAGPRGEKVELVVDASHGSAAAPAAAAPAGAAGPPRPYSAGAYKSRLLAVSEGRQVWGIDADEIDWASANVPQILDRDLQVVPYAGGGLRVEAVAPDSIGAARGLLAGDVVREVDGRPVGGVSDLHHLLDRPSATTSQGLRLTIERAGKPLVLEYRPLPR